MDSIDELKVALSSGITELGGRLRARAVYKKECLGEAVLSDASARRSVNLKCKM